jgi:UrcA family protein
MSYRVVFAAAAAALVAAVPAAYAQPAHVGEVIVHAPAARSAGQEVKSEAVSYSDLNPSTDDGAKALLGRIRRAAKHVCSPAPSHNANVRDTNDYRSCRHGAVSVAVQDLNNPTVSRLYQASK